MTDDCKHKNTRGVIDCLELAITLKCDDCGISVKSRPLTEDEVNRIVEKELGRYGKS